MTNKPDNLLYTRQVKEKAQQLGFQACGIAKPNFLAAEEQVLAQWLGQNKHGYMDYMAKYFDKRLDPRLLLPEAQSVVMLLYNYAPARNIFEHKPIKIARYAYGKDYHVVLKNKLKHMVSELEEKIGHFAYKIFVDTAPVWETVWAEKAGIGWRGKHSLLINKRMGSYFFLAGMLTDLPLQADKASTAHCGNCTACIDACPTQAILPNGEVEATRCISYLTIEVKGEHTAPWKEHVGDWAYGCDICQEVCPWNRFASSHEEEAFMPNTYLQHLSLAEWEAMSQETFQKVFQKSAVKRAKYEGFKKNIQWVLSSK